MSRASLHICETEDAKTSLVSQPEQNTIARISLEALRLGQEYVRRGASFAEVSQALYRYNSTPLSPRLSRSLSSNEAIDDLLGLQRPEMRSLMSEHWIPTTRSWEAGAWHCWGRRAIPYPASNGPLLHKLYVSPRLEHFGTALQLILPILAELRAPAFKWGRKLNGLLRPDKFVIYFHNRESLSDCATRLRSVLDSTWAQGVPFTAEIGDTRLLSWAIDPSLHTDSADVAKRLSWRQWVCNHIAESFLAKRTPSDKTEPWMAALRDLRQDGIDTDTWTWREFPEAAR